MNKKKHTSIYRNTVLIISACCVISNLMAGESYSIEKYVIANGGGVSSEGAYTLVGTMAQVSIGKSTGGEYLLQSGYWNNTSVNNDVIFKNGFE